MALEEDEGFKLCVTSRRRVRDLSHRNLTNVPSDLSSTTQYLDISHNHIERLDAGPFSSLSQLCLLKVSYCGLRVISPNVFDRIPGLKVLNISHNLISVIPDLPLTQLRILDLTSNVYDSYQLPATFQNLIHLDFLAVGSKNALSVNNNDFAPLRDVSLHRLLLGAGIEWQKYESGSLAKLKSLQNIILNVTFCKNFGMLENLLVDLNETQTMAMTFVKLFPDDCVVPRDPFKNLRTMQLIQNLTFVHTWLNSSFMVKLVKNVLLSPLHKLAFVNIIYNEDTPDGFQLPSLNHTANIRSVIFDGVRHYQIKYPIINISMDSISEMTYLKFSGTGMNISPCNLISALPSLETLDLSDNLLSDNGFWWPTCSYTSVFPKLKELSLSKNRFMRLSFIADKTHQMKNLESLDLSFNAIRLELACSWPNHLKELSLSNNNLGNTVFRYLSPHFERIDLSKTGITAITQDVLLQFPRLTHLLLSSNSIQVIPVDLEAPSLLSLYVDQNAITSVSMDSLDGLPRLQTLKAGNNPFACTCDSYWFLTALNKSMLSDWPLDYTCSIPPSVAGLPLSEYKTSKLACESWLQATVALPVIFAITAAFGLVFYICDGVWYTKMLWVWIRVKRRGHKHAEMLLKQSFQYHAFISYSHHDSDWVDSKLVPSLEGVGLSLCIHERDFVPGEWIIDNIINCVETSYKTLFVLSNHFVQSEWCNYELFFAQHRAINVQQDSLVFILLEPIPTDSMPKKFLKLRTLLRQQTYLEWPRDERKQQVFWASLKSILRAADKSLVIKDVALDIADTVHLLIDQGK